VSALAAEIVPAELLQPGDRIDVDGVTATVLRAGVEAVETVWPLAGRPCLRVWGRREDTGAEGFMTYGPGGVARVIS
jgi:hypothetical protein